MRRIILFLLIIVFSVNAFLNAKSTLALDLAGQGKDQVHTLNCHPDFYTFIEVNREEQIKKIIMLENDDWEIDTDGPFIWIRPKNEEAVRTTLAILTESGRMYIFTVKIVDSEELFYPKIYITGAKSKKK
ncbi:MAG: TrbG/VirB9 family P-type conjugative transfer protein [Candidatus Aminicenantes bacterium]|nr:TrbG/VirB9 family P-type conjugative transfer protein [Candidatus Aminicenantes bacterium]